jgi:hypothetical protein
MVRAMTKRIYFALTTCLGIAALMLQSSETLARSGAVPGGAFAAMHPAGRPGVAPFRHHHRRSFVGGIYWPDDYGYAYGTPYGEPVTPAPQGGSQDIHYTTTYDVPWDWAHRYPPQVAPSDRPYVSSCPVERVTVAGRDGGEQIINVMRCY